MRVKQVARRRLDAQRISSTTFTRADQVVAWLGAVQAQDYLGALWAVGLRLADATEKDVERALTERRIVRTWPMRGTLHFVAAADARWMTELLARRPVAAAAGRLRKYGIDEAVLSRARRILVKNLDGGRRLTRPAAYRVLEDAGIAPGGERGPHILWRLAQDCVVCFGPREGKQQTFALFDEWLPRAKSLPRDEALATLATRYFRSHGPATLRDFAWWSGLTVADARHATLIAGKQIAERTIDGERHWWAPGNSARVDARGGTHVLPAFDEFLVGYADRSASIDASIWGQVGMGGIIHPVVVRDGQVVGTWRRRTEKREVVCSVASFARPNGAASRDVTLALQRYASFLGLGLRRSEPIERAARR
jgi:hypothetical protein